MDREVKILLKRTANYYTNPTTKVVNPNVGNYILLFGEPMYLKDAGWVVIGEGAEYNTFLEAQQVTTDPNNVMYNEMTAKYIGGPTVSQLVTAHKILNTAQFTELYGNATYQYLDGTGAAKPIPVTTDSLTIANTAFVHDVIETLDANLNGTTPATNKTLSSFTQVDGKVSATFNDISLPYGQITGTKFASDSVDLPKMNGNNAALGSILRWARADHVHPKDISKADITEALGAVSWNSTSKAVRQRLVSGEWRDTNITASTLKSAMDLNNVPNESKATMFTSPNFTGSAKYNGNEIATQVYVTNALANKSVVEAKTALGSGTIYVTGVTGANGALYYNTTGSHSGVKIDCATGVLMGAAWNDFAEYRKCQGAPGTVVCETGKGDLIIANERLQPGAAVISDTYGMVIGDDSEGNLPVAVAGRVLALYGGDAREFKPGMPVCAGPFGRIYPMTREEIKEYPEAIVGYVSEIPDYEEWNGVKIAKRIWIKVK